MVSRDLCSIGGGGRVNLQWVYVHCAIYICNVFGVLVFQRSMLDWRRGGVNLPWVYVHCAISAKFSVAVFKASLLDCRGQSAMGIGALCYI